MLHIAYCKNGGNVYVTVKATHNKAQVRGRRTFQPKVINWSYLNLGKVARTHIKENITNIVLIPNQA